jgi:predicted unusual protein kinase regulating ubiquinone biosynthesis (AarF/ABC1/UbiB family)
VAVTHLSPSHLSRYKDMAALLIRHRRLIGGSDQTYQADEAERGEGGSDAVRSDADALARELEELGPTFVKLGQLLSTRADLLPAPYLEALARLQEDVEPFGFDEVERIVSLELGVRLSKGFRSFESTPLASASLGQVHRAEMAGPSS